MRPTQTNPADDDIDAMEGQTSSALLGDKKVKPQQEIPLCGCISIQYYQPYFDVDTADVTSRLYKSLLFCTADTTFMQTIADKPDAYGPFWVLKSHLFLSYNFLYFRSPQHSFFV